MMSSCTVLVKAPIVLVVSDKFQCVCVLRFIGHCMYVTHSPTHVILYPYTCTCMSLCVSLTHAHITFYVV